MTLKSPVRVLVVDDEAMVSRLLKLNLERAGPFEVQTENDATQALAAARQFQPDVILLDLSMPHRSGLEVAREIRSEEAFKQTPVIFFSGTMFEGEVTVSHGSLVLAKPISVQKIIHCIEQQLSLPA